MKKIGLTFLFLCALSYTLVAQRIVIKDKLPEHTHTGQYKQNIMIPNAFSPNGDGQNDIFMIRNITDEKLIDFRIFNRWGTIMFRTNNPSDGWDGSFKGEMQPIGTYGYVIRIGYPDGYVETYKGTLSLIR